MISLTCTCVLGEFGALDACVHWNICAQCLAQPLWDRSLYVVSTSCDALASVEGSRPTVLERDIFLRSYIEKMKADNGGVKVKLILQFPAVIQNLTCQDELAAEVKWLGTSITALVSLLQSGCSISQVSAAYAIGLIGRLMCNPQTWKIQQGVSPRPILQNHIHVCAGGDILVLDRNMQLFDRAWEDVKPDQSLAHASASANSIATRCELVRGFASILRYSSRPTLERGTPHLSSLLCQHWQLLCDAEAPVSVRNELARQASLVTSNGSKVTVD